MSGLSEPAGWLHLDWVLIVVGAWLLVGAVGVLALRRLDWVAKVLFPVGGAFALVLFGVALGALFATPEVAVLPIGLPGLPFHLRLDSLAGLLPDGDRRGVGRRVGVRRRLLPQGRRHAARACCAWSTTSFSPAWRWSCWPTTPTPSW